MCRRALLLCVFLIGCGPPPQLEPAALIFSSQPVNAVSGATLLPPPQVSLVDEFGKVVTNKDATITISLVPENPIPAGSLGGKSSVDLERGVATFASLRIYFTGRYRLLAAGAGFTVESDSFVISRSSSGGGGLCSVSTPPTCSCNGGVIARVPCGGGFTLPGCLCPSGLQFATQPSNGVPGQPLSVQPTVRFTGGQVWAAEVSLALIGPAGATLTGETVSGICPICDQLAKFTNVGVSTSGIGYRLEARAGELVAVSDPFDVRP